MKALHSLTNSCDFADLKFRLAEMRGTYHFGALSMGYVSFWRSFTEKDCYFNKIAILFSQHQKRLPFVFELLFFFKLKKSKENFAIIIDK